MRSMADSGDDLTTLLERLVASGTEFVLVGGLAAVAQGAPITTFDVDIVHQRTPENVGRLLALFRELHARLRGQPDPPLLPDRAALLGPERWLLATDLGPLDVLGAIEGGRTYEELAPDCVVLELEDRPLRVLSLDE